MITPQEIGARIRARRELLGYYQGDVAKHLGMSRSNYVKYESGDVTASSIVLSEIAKFLALPVAVLYGEEPMPIEGDDRELLNYYHRVRPEFRTAAKAAVKSMVDIANEISP